MAEQSFMPDPKGFLPDPMSTPIGDGTSTSAGSNTAPFLPYHDLREWIEEASKLGEVQRGRRALLAARHRHGRRRSAA